MGNYLKGRTVSERESADLLLNAIMTQAVHDCVDVFKNSLVYQADFDMAGKADAEMFLQMKHEDGTYVFPWERIKYNTEHGVRMFMIYHFTHLPSRWSSGRPKSLVFDCPICGQGKAQPCFSKRDAKNLYFKHKCDRCGFQVYTPYSCLVDDYIKRVKESDFNEFVRDQIYAVERLEFMKIEDDELLSDKKKTAKAKERIEWWNEFKKNAGL